MKEWSYTSRQVQGYFILLIKTPRGEGLKGEIVITLKNGGYLYRRFFSRFKRPPCLCVSRRTLNAFPSDWTAMVLFLKEHIVKERKKVLIVISRLLTGVKNSEHHGQDKRCGDLDSSGLKLFRYFINNFSNDFPETFHHHDKYHNIKWRINRDRGFCHPLLLCKVFEY